MPLTSTTMWLNFKNIILNKKEPSIRKYEFLAQEKLHTIEIITMVVSEGYDRLEEGMWNLYECWKYYIHYMDIMEV